MRLKRISQIDFSGGVQGKTLPKLASANQVLHALNADFDKRIGATMGREGSERKSVVVAAQKIINMFIHKQGTTRHYLSVSDDGAGTPKVDVYKNASANFAGAWSKSLEDLTTVVDVWFASFIQKTFFFNGADAPKSYDGSNWSAVTNAPTAGKFPAVFKQRLYVLTESGILHYSDVVNATGDDFTSTTWSNRGINPNDGQIGKMLRRHRGRLIIWKEESIYRYDGTNEPEASINIGTHSGRSVVLTDKHAYFHHPSGIYRMGLGDPEIISRPVEKYLDGMSSANWENVAAGKDLTHIYFWIGDVTISDPHEWDYNTTYTDVVLVYNIFSERWQVYSGWNARVWFYDEENGDTYFGTAAGKIFKINAGIYVDKDSATETPIPFEVLLHPQDYGYPEKYKTVNQVFLIGSHQLKISAGESADKLDAIAMMENGVAIMNTPITCKKLWIRIFESYEKLPPVIEQVIYDKAEVFDDK